MSGVLYSLVESWLPSQSSCFKYTESLCSCPFLSSCCFFVPHPSPLPPQQPRVIPGVIVGDNFHPIDQSALPAEVASQAQPAAPWRHRLRSWFSSSFRSLSRAFFISIGRFTRRLSGTNALLSKCSRSRTRPTFLEGQHVESCRTSHTIIYNSIIYLPAFSCDAPFYSRMPYCIRALLVFLQHQRPVSCDAEFLTWVKMRSALCKLV